MFEKNVADIFYLSLYKNKCLCGRDEVSDLKRLFIFHKEVDTRLSQSLHQHPAIFATRITMPLTQQYHRNYLTVISNAYNSNNNINHNPYPE